jgi:hypothetical protein
VHFLNSWVLLVLGSVGMASRTIWILQYFHTSHLIQQLWYTQDTWISLSLISKLSYLVVGAGCIDATQPSEPIAVGCINDDMGRLKDHGCQVGNLHCTGALTRGDKLSCCSNLINGSTVIPYRLPWTMPTWPGYTPAVLLSFYFWYRLLNLGFLF